MNLEGKIIFLSRVNKNKELENMVIEQFNKIKYNQEVLKLLVECGNINKTLIYECIYMFIKAMLISIVLSIPIIYIIIKSMEEVIILDKILIPFGSIGLFILILFVMSLIVTLYSTRFIKEK